jgi:molybdopterin-guanine dinucleotide biosynthesis protein A
MGSPKHLLKLPDGTPLYQHQVNTLRQACPSVPTIYISLARDSALDGFLRELSDPRIKIIYDEENNPTTRSGGPAQGLLSAHSFDPTATWIVLAVDYPLMTVETILQLCDSYEPPVTCFRNDDGFLEPLVSVWSPEALRRLEEKGGGAGPSAFVKEMNGKSIKLNSDSRAVLKNINTAKEYEDMLMLSLLRLDHPVHQLQT